MADDQIKETANAAGKRKTRKDAPNVAKAVARAMWSAQWREENPDGNAETRRAAWKDVRNAEIRKARKFVRLLERSGIRLSMTDNTRGAKNKT